jgi:hypothetical protein
MTFNARAAYRRGVLPLGTDAAVLPLPPDVPARPTHLKEVTDLRRYKQRSPL